MEGLFIMTTDGARVEGLSVSNVTMKNVAQPILLMVGDRARGPEGTRIGTMRNIALSDIIITGPYSEEIHETMAQNSADDHMHDLVKPMIPLPFIISGQADSVIENISLSNIIFVAPGGGKAEDSEIQLKEVRKEYPMALEFGKKAPVYGMYARHVNKLRLYNVDFSTVLKDEREAVKLEQVTGFREV